MKYIIFFFSTWNRIIHIKVDKYALISTIQFDRWKNVVFIMEQILFNDNVSDPDMIYINLTLK